MSDRCSVTSAQLGEQLAGTAPHAPAWVALEQSGPWGAQAFTGSHLDPDVGRQLEATAAAHQVRPALIRCPGRHADEHARTGVDRRRLLVAFTHPGRSWLLEGTIGRPDDVLRLDWSAVASGNAEGVRRSLPALQPSARAHLLVCTNGTRDVCCAVYGRPVALAAVDRFPEQVWEVTHTSGHRFAPTCVLLPAGTLHGRLDGAAAAELLDAAGRGETVLAGSRGRSTWPSAAQVAELVVREQTGELSLDALCVVDHVRLGEHAWRTDVGHRDGRRWTVRVEAHESGQARAESCGKALKPLVHSTTMVR